VAGSHVGDGDVDGDRGWGVDRRARVERFAPISRPRARVSIGSSVRAALNRAWPLRDRSCPSPASRARNHRKTRNRVATLSRRAAAPSAMPEASAPSTCVSGAGCVWTVERAPWNGGCRSQRRPIGVEDRAERLLLQPASLRLRRCGFGHPEPVPGGVLVGVLDAVGAARRASRVARRPSPLVRRQSLSRSPPLLTSPAAARRHRPASSVGSRSSPIVVAAAGAHGPRRGSPPRSPVARRAPPVSRLPSLRPAVPARFVSRVLAPWRTPRARTALRRGRTP
jgi:hypothetical protein